MLRAFCVCMSLALYAPLAWAVQISEIRIDQPSADDDEYVELTGAPGEDLSRMTYLVIGDGVGGSGVVENVTNLTSSVNANGFYVVAESTFTLGSAD